MLPAVIATERLHLLPLYRTTARAIVNEQRTGERWHDEFPRRDDRDAARRALRHGDQVFGCFAIVEVDTGLTIGTIGFFGPPDAAGAAMVGCGLVPAARGQGYATEALRALADYAFAQPAVRRLLADPPNDNVALHRVLEKAGFRHTHTTDDFRWYAVENVATAA